MRSTMSTGYLIILCYMLACLFRATHLVALDWNLIRGSLFYLVFFLGGLYLADVLHLVISHRHRLTSMVS